MQVTLTNTTVSCVGLATAAAQPAIELPSNAVALVSTLPPLATLSVLVLVRCAAAAIASRLQLHVTAGLTHLLAGCVEADRLGQEAVHAL